MARVPYLTQDDLPDEYRYLLDERPINLRRALVNIPPLAESYARIADWFRAEGTVDPRLRELAILYVGYSHASAYAFCQHVRIGTRHGVTHDDIRAIIDVVNGRDVALRELDALVIDATRQLTHDVRLADATWEALVEALGSAGAMEMVVAISHYNYVVRMLAGLRMDVEDDWAAPLAEYDPPESAGRWH
jgi:alkylhydroperoxidase family enzyme